MPRARIGCTGWSYPDWVGPFYAPGTPPTEWLRAYSRAFDFTEVDSSFYAAPSRERAASWARATPDGFSFSLKLPRAITHDAKLRDTEDAVGSFLAALAPLRVEGKLGPCVAQLPPSFRYEADAEALAAFVGAWPRDAPLVVELRNRSWWREETYATLRDAGVALAWSVNETGRTPPVRTADLVYVRLVGDRALDETGGKWTHVQRRQDEEIEHWRGVLGSILENDPITTWIVANNHFMGFAPETARVVAQALGVLAPQIERVSRKEGQRGLGDFARE
ncbi:MAG TPA: DUF72 domain-containing protein [Candidatus Thermoplasmatota archaeon]|nr:DUF72 domain-containing protein [Candidatus Thermoplasmatota archaeon]